MPGRNGRNPRRGRRHFRRGGNQHNLCETEKPATTNAGELEKINKNAREKPHLLFTNNVTFSLHYDAQESNHLNYWATLFTLIKSGYDLSSGNKALILAAAWAHKDYKMADQLLNYKEQFGIVEVVKTLTLLDSGRKIREWEKTMKSLELQKGKPKQSKLSNCKQNIENLKVIKPKVGSVSGALIRRVKKWVKQQSADQLEYFALFYPKESWKKLADLCHLNPEKDFACLQWFLPFCFGESAPDSSLVKRCSSINEENVNEIILATDVPYSYIKRLAGVLNEESKTRIATYTESLSTVLWNYEDLACTEVDKVISKRLEAGEDIDLTYGKLMERLLMLAMRSKSNQDNEVPFLTALMDQAERRLKNISVSLKAPVAVLGDRSPSMGVAIRTSTIIASLVANITQAKLSFFASQNYDIEVVPKTVKEVIQMATTIETTGATSPAASLLPYYERQEVAQTFVVVTDEWENTVDKRGNMFGPLFEKYHKEVYPADLVFVSFLPQSSNGQMVPKLQEKGFDPLRFKFDSSRPDLTKLDAMLAMLSIDTEEFNVEVQKVALELNAAENVNSAETAPHSEELTLESLTLNPSKQ